MSRTIVTVSNDSATIVRHAQVLGSGADAHVTTALEHPADVSEAMAAVPDGVVVAVVVCHDVPADAAIDFLGAVDVGRPLAAAVFEGLPDGASMRQAMSLGVRAIVDPAAAPQDLVVAVADALDAAMRRRRQLLPDAPPDRRVLTVVSAKGGTGKTTLAANIAVALAAAAPGQVALVDFDLQFGDVEYALRLKPETTIADLARAGDKVDATSVKAFLTPHPTGVFALCAPARPAEAEELDADGLGQVIDLLASQFRYVVVDTAGGIDDAALVAMDHATDLVLMSSTDIPSVRALQKTTEALRAIGLDGKGWHYVLNRSDAKVALTADDVSDAVGLEIDLAIPDSRVMTLAMNQGAPIVETDPRSTASRRIADFANRFVATDPEVRRSRGFSLRGSR